MRMKSAVLLLFLACLLFTSATQADEADDAKKALTQAHKDLSEALGDNDVSAILNRLPADWKIVNSAGHLMGRDQLEEVLKGGKLKFLSHTTSDLDVRTFGDAAVIIGRGNLRASWEGEEFQGNDRFTEVWVRREGKWSCVSTHTSRLSE
jgi:ketosteroid isomerase-like protein